MEWACGMKGAAAAPGSHTGIRHIKKQSKKSELLVHFLIGF
jgi:hypothetical protein